MVGAISRREFAWLLAALVGGYAASLALRETAPLGRDLAADPAVPAMLADTFGPQRPAPGADLTMLVFTDYQCPACKLAEPAMERALAADGHVRVLYRDFPIFGALSERAARVAIAADFQGIYPQVHRRLMAERRALTPVVLREAVESAGGDWARIQHDLVASSAAIDHLLARNRSEAIRLNIGGTPAFLVGHTLILGAIDEGQFRRAFALGRGRGP